INSSFGSILIISARTDIPPIPESKTPMGSLALGLSMKIYFYLFKLKISFTHKVVCNGHSPARAKSLGRYFDTRRCLLPLVFVSIHLFDNLTHYFFFISHLNNFVNTLCILHVRLQYSIQDIVRGQGVLVELIRF